MSVAENYFQKCHSLLNTVSILKKEIIALKMQNADLKQQLEDCEFAHRTEMAHHRVVEQELKEKIAKRDYTSQKLYDGDVE